MKLDSDLVLKKLYSLDSKCLILPHAYMQCDVYIAMMLILKALDCYVST